VTVITDLRCTEYAAPGHPERPERISRTVELLKSRAPSPFRWELPPEADDKALLRAHTPEHLQRLARSEDFDGDTPAYPRIAEHARRSVGGAVRALALARQGEPALSLLRPPGHHATPDRAMGFCYLNSVAIAALEARAAGYKRVAVFDFDVHHGNGTEDILLDKPGLVFISIHQHPCYPGTGVTNRGTNCFNFPVRPHMPRAEYRAVLASALAKLKESQPDMVAVSAGFDSYVNDPLAQGTLEREDFHWLGESMRALAVPTFSVLEGGYSEELPRLILAYIQGLNGWAL
jgi:acetoin utilization deacetylase AcuC-like enzyme